MGVLDIHTAIIAAIESITEIKTTFKGIIPPPSKVNKYPSVAINFDRLDKARANTGDCNFQVDESVDLYIYSRAAKSNVYEDVIPPLVALIDEKLNTDVSLNALVYDAYVANVVTDGGLTYPTVVARVKVKLEYRLTKPY